MNERTDERMNETINLCKGKSIIYKFQSVKL